MKKVVQDLTSGGLLGVWGKWMKHAKYIYNIQDFNPEQVLAVGYTKSKLITDKLSQGAHEESEHVQTSGLSNPVERTVLNCDKVLASMNREVQTQRTEQFLEPYYEVCEQIELFEVGLRSLRGQTRLVAEQLFVEGKKQTEITGADGNNLTRRTVVREKKNALVGIADTICRYQKR